jgi:hypothetical protein
MNQDFGPGSDQLEEAPEEPVFLARHAAFFGKPSDAKEDWSKKGRGSEEEPVFGLGSTSPKRRLSW